ncbi:hypothetical protein GE09DRAFT_465751 [Coniochaeta sp. 2T2.1]|nr:hypothetical protein GE09DRAFT_465751 [Coniochaeta sp. 2T2.1]
MEGYQGVLSAKYRAVVPMTNDAASVTELLLTCFPLAITQAATYLGRNEVLIAEYPRLLRHTEKSMVELLSEELPDRTRYNGAKNAVATTWMVSYEKIRQLHRNAADFLSIKSQIEPKSIAQSLLPLSEFDRCRKEYTSASPRRNAY